MTGESVALGVSVIALLVSGIAALIAWKSFHREGALVSGELDIREPTRVHNGVVAGDVSLTVSNEGLAAIGVNNALWIIEYEEATLVAVVEPEEGPSLPMTLAGLHSATWAFDFEEMSHRVPSGVAKARVIFYLGNGSQVSTPLAPLPSVTSRALDVEDPN